MATQGETVNLRRGAAEARREPPPLRHEADALREVDQAILAAQNLAPPSLAPPSMAAQSLVAQSLAEGVSSGPAAHLPNYELLGLLGAGGMGTVYKARHAWLGRIAAVKLSPAGAGGEAAARFLRETRAVGALDHRHIVRAADAGRAGDFHYLVTEFVDGEDLERLVARRGPLPVADACELIRQAALGLEHAHGQGLIHRDVKPSNLMLDRSGVVKVLDLGLARFSAGFGTLTESGQVMGTLDYMAPEQAGGAKHVNGRADIYSLGCTLYFLLTGRPPFSGAQCDTAAAKIMAHLHATAPPISTQRRDAPSAVVRCVERMLAKNPADRFASMAQVAGKLAPHAEGAEPKQLLNDHWLETTSTPWYDRVITWRDVGWAMGRMGGAVVGAFVPRPTPTPAPGLAPAARGRLLSPFTWIVLALLGFLFGTGAVSCEYVPEDGAAHDRPSWLIVNERSPL